jgi:ABC-type glycerol-3-phosphate transport system substrate-binding protein
MMAYNKDLLLRKGLELPKNDWTMDDFTRMLELVGGGEGDQRIYGYQMDTWDESLLYSKDVQWADLKSSPPEPMLNSQDMVSFVEWLVALKNSGGIYLQQPENYAEADELLRSGRIAFFRTNASQPKGWFFDNQEANFEIGVAPFPLFNDPTGSFFMNISRGYMISRNARNPQACWDFMTYLSEQPTIQMGVPARRSVMESSRWEAAVGKENAEAMRAAVKNLQPQVMETHQYYDPISYPLSTWRNEAIRKALNGAGVTEALDAAQQITTAYLGCMEGMTFDQTSEESIRNYVEKIRACAAEADPEGMMWQSSP